LVDCCHTGSLTSPAHRPIHGRVTSTITMEGRELARWRVLAVGPAAFEFPWFPVRGVPPPWPWPGCAPFPPHYL